MMGTHWAIMKYMNYEIGRGIGNAVFMEKLMKTLGELIK